MKNWKFDLFNFRQELTLDQLEISHVVEGHLQQFDKFSERELVSSLKESLSAFSYDADVKKLIESFDEELVEMPLLYNLKERFELVKNDPGSTLKSAVLFITLNSFSKVNKKQTLSLLLS